jgi:hypothetical protein
MEIEELDAWVDAYIEIYESESSNDEHHPCYWAIEKFADLEMEHLHGVEYISNIEREAQSNLNFRILLRELVETSDKNIWSQILRARSDD